MADRKVVSLPEVQSYIVQPNRITNSIYSYTLFQERILTAIMFYLQEPINQSMQGRDYNQLELFTQSEFINLYVPLKEISEPNQYPQVKMALKEMASIVIEVPFKKDSGKEWIKITNLLNAEIPNKGEYRGYMVIEIRKMVAEILVNIDRNNSGQSPASYTKFIYQIAQNATNKYTARLYKLICSWREKGTFNIKLETLKEQLGVKGKYREFTDFKRRVLIPAFNELYKRSDCWFNLNDEDFEIREGQLVTHLHFRVITAESAKIEETHIDYVRYLLRNYFSFGKPELEKVDYIFHNPTVLIAEVTHKVTQLAEYLDENPVSNRKAYALKSLLNAYPEK